MYFLIFYNLSQISEVVLSMIRTILLPRFVPKTLLMLEIIFTTLKIDWNMFWTKRVALHKKEKIVKSHWKEVAKFLLSFPINCKFMYTKLYSEHTLRHKANFIYMEVKDVVHAS